MFLPLMLPIQMPQVKPTLEIRERFERRIDRDFDSGSADNRSDLLSRWRLGAKFPIGQDGKGEFRWQYAHNWSWTQQRNFSTWNSDADIASVQREFQGGTLTIGRQKVSIGSQRLIGALEWMNAGRSMDGVRVKSKAWDFWATKISVGNPKPRDARLIGLVNTNSLGLTSLIHKTDKIAEGRVSNTTLSHWHTQSTGDVALDLEGAIQAGRSAGRDQQGWALHLRAARPIGGGTTAYLEGNAASGGQNDDDVNTFDHLYGTNHGKYGLMDMQGWKNMHELAVGLDHKTQQGILVRFSWHKFMLEDAKDAWYGAAGAPNRHATGVFRDPTGVSGRDVGSEIDLEAIWNPRETLSVSAGLASFRPGKFVRRVGGAGDKQTWGYIQVQAKF